MKGFDGEHCETVAIGTLLAQRGSGLSEPMLFGLGEGLSFIFLTKSKSRDGIIPMTQGFCDKSGRHFTRANFDEPQAERQEEGI